MRDTEPAGHCKRVTAFTIAIAKAMGTPRGGIDIIARAAFLHDIGNLCIPVGILQKPGAFTEEELAMVRGHCYEGYTVLKRISFLSEAAEIVYAHHERFDGNGYPRGLRGEEIPFGARVFAVADTLEAITTDRPYRRAGSFTAAREEIKRWSGRQFDPEVVRAFLSPPPYLWYDLSKNVSSSGSGFP